MRYIIALYDSIDGDVTTYKTDDIRSTVGEIANEGYDLGFSINGGATAEEVETIVQHIDQHGCWNGEDSVLHLIVIDTHNIDHER